MDVCFSNDRYFETACQMAGMKDDVPWIRPEEAFSVLVRGVKKSQLDNLISRIRKEFQDMSEDMIYDRIQKTLIGSERVIDPENGADDRVIDSLFLKCAFDCLEAQEPLGTETINNGKINTSDWIAHSLWEAKLCGILAKRMGLDRDRAVVMGMLHDYGRKETHTFDHVIRGFELLTDLGLKNEAVGCLTHSFINGGRCASNEQAEPGFYVSEEGTACWQPDHKKDQMTLFLEKYTYTEYDRILNLADLMATSHGIVSPYDRILDIATRRTIDPVNRGYFLAELINLLYDISAKLNYVCGSGKNEPVRFQNSDTIDAMMERFQSISEQFFSEFSGRGQR